MSPSIQRTDWPFARLVACREHVRRWIDSDHRATSPAKLTVSMPVPQPYRDGSRAADPIGRPADSRSGAVRVVVVIEFNESRVVVVHALTILARWW
jgi:hypothetical protein